MEKETINTLKSKFRSFLLSPREMTLKDIGDTILAYGQAAARVEKAGFDAIQLHCAWTSRGGVGVEDMLRTAAMLADACIDALEVSRGTTTALMQGNPEASWAKTTPTEAYWREAVTRLKKTVDVPVMLVGGIRSYEVADKLIEDSVADYISMCHPFIREPDLVNMWKSGNTRKATCVSENACTAPTSTLMQGKGLQCAHMKT